MAVNIRWGLDNPHSFPHIKIGLIWERKYDEYANYCRVNIVESLTN